MTSSNIFPPLLSLCAGKPQVKVDSPHKGTVTRTFDVFCCQCKKTVEQTLDWPVFRDTMTVIWRRRNVLNSPSMVVAGGLTPIWCQDILNRRGEIGQLHIYRHAFFFIKIVPWYQLLCGSGNVTHAFLWLHRCIVCNYCNAVYFRLVLFLLKRHKMSTVQVVTLYKPKPSCFSLKELWILDMYSHHQCRHWFGKWLGTVRQQTVTSLPEPMLTMLRDAILHR